MPNPSYEVTLTLGRIKEEHVPWVVKAMNILADLFALEGTDLNTDISVERNRDGIERVHEYLPGIPDPRSED